MGDICHEPYPPRAPACLHQPLAESPLGSVSICPDCGVVQLTMDAVSVRLDMEAFHLATQMMVQARSRVHALMDERARHAAMAAQPAAVSTVH